MDPKSKLELAVKFLESLDTGDIQELADTIAKDCGALLSEFFTTYAGTVMKRRPDMAEELAGSLMLIGYLIKANEIKRQTSETSNLFN